jgi:hypothetical protein
MQALTEVFSKLLCPSFLDAACRDAHEKVPHFLAFLLPCFHTFRHCSVFKVQVRGIAALRARLCPLN